jgi:hypothetical protein
MKFCLHAGIPLLRLLILRNRLLIVCTRIETGRLASGIDVQAMVIAFRRPMAIERHTANAAHQR